MGHICNQLGFHALTLHALVYCETYAILYAVYVIRMTLKCRIKCLTVYLITGVAVCDFLSASSYQVKLHYKLDYYAKLYSFYNYEP